MLQLFKLFSNFKKRLNSVFSYNRKILILGIILGIFLCVFNFQAAEALYSLKDLKNDILGPIIYIFTLPIRMVFVVLVLVIGILGLVASSIFTFVASLLSWLIQESLSIKVVPGPDTFEAVNVGFEFTRNFANMFIILILAMIGLATILKMREYEARKILPKLLMVALLINFTPVMVGFIVDIANLFTNFFFTEVSNAFGPIDIGIDIMEDMKDLLDPDFSVANPKDVVNVVIPIVIKGIIMIIFYNIATFVYLLVFLLFFVRFIILWVLVILAPIAFLSQILPESPTVKALFPSILHWNKWWETLIQWAVIGIPLGFFLYLSAFILDGRAVLELNNPDSPFGAIIGAILGPMIAIFILIVGIMISIESAPGIAQRIYGGASKLGKKVAKITGKRAALPIAGKAGAGIQAWGERQRLAGVKTPGQIAKAGRLRKWGWALRRKTGTITEKTGRRMVVAKQESETADVEVAKKTTKGKAEGKQMVKLQSALTKSALPGATPKIIGTMEAMMEDGTLEKAEKAGIFGTKEYQKYVKEAGNRNRKSLQLYDMKRAAQVVEPEKWQKGQTSIDEGKAEIEKAEIAINPIEKLMLRKKGEELIHKGEEIKKEPIRKMLAGIKPSDMKLMSEKSLTDDTVKKAMVDTLNGNQMAEIGKNFGRHIVEGIQKEIEGKETVEKVAEKNPPLTLWLHGNAAQNLGFKLPGKHLERREVKEVVNKAQKRIENKATIGKREMKIKYTGKETLMFRDYYRKDISEKEKGLIKQIVTEEKKTIPPEAEIKRRIGKTEKRFGKTDESLKPYRENLKKAKKAWKQANRPTSGDIYKLLKETERRFENMERKVKKTQEAIEKEIESKLEDLWK
ncbi:MAG: hypothetical protein KJI70_02845 [Patescibacteria group bacterium]|nr:hypothetical protein [Patescibacteria group bacterium]